MKKLLLLFMFSFFIIFSMFSQTEETKLRTNEIGLDLFDLAIMRTVDISYEYIKKPEIGFGVTGRYCFDSYEEAFNNEKYGITPFFRYYFYNKQDYGSKGFYVEGFMKFFGGKEYNWNYDNGGYDNYFETAFGVGIGFKYVSNRGIVVDLNIGGGRSFGISDISPGVTGRSCIMFGYRF